MSEAKLKSLQPAIEKLSADGHSCVGADRDGKIIFVSKECGLKPLMDRIMEDPDGLRGLYIADKIIGKAAACLIIYAGAAACHGLTMSEPASRLLNKSGVPFSYGQMVPFIRNKAGTGMCPTELAVETAEGAASGFEAIMSFFNAKAR